MTQVKWYYYLILLAAGMIWGATIPGNKVIMSTGLPIIGVLFWQGVLVGLLAFALAIWRGARFRLNGQRLRLVVAIGFLGTLIPNFLAYWVVQHIPAGVLAITIALVPIFVMPIALALGKEKFEWIRVAGVLCGAFAILLIVGPEAALPDRAKIFFVFIALIPPICYAMEDNYIAYFGRDNMHALSILTCAMVVVIALTLPIALIRGEFFLLGAGGMDRAQWTLIFISFAHCIAYATFIWLIGQTGPVFTSFVAYLVTGFGVIWSVVWLGETYSYWVWGAFGVMLIAMFLVQPRESDA